MNQWTKGYIPVSITTCNVGRSKTISFTPVHCPQIDRSKGYIVFGHKA